ncbi:hypothetical protein [Streptomyces sp. NPDC051561]|uniref:hypothetical protein n=1 Tax=Streptomyces sp. NPDC051561 TaxID=3365658 RepID=UPI0037BA6A79
MSTTVTAAPSNFAPAASPVLSEEERVAMLSIRRVLEPELSLQYATDPLAVLAAFGLSAAEPVFTSAGSSATVSIEELDRPGPATMLLPTWRTFSDAPKTA